MSALVDAALAAAGLSDLERARANGAPLGPFEDALARADLLVVGALADRIRAGEVGDAVRIYAGVPADASDDVVCVAPEVASAEAAGTGLGFLRAVALARIRGPRAARVRVDWQEVGLELAQVALGFGASELVGVLASKRGLPLAEGQMSGVGKKSTHVPMALAKRRELAGFVRRSGRTPLFVTASGELEPLEPDAAEPAIFAEEGTP